MKVPFPFTLLACTFSVIRPCASAPLDLGLGGVTEISAWHPDLLKASANPGFPVALNYMTDWPGPIHPEPGGGNATLTKISNGPTGAPIPSGQSLYFLSFLNGANTPGGVLSINENSPVENLTTLALQIEVGGANGYDLLNNDLTREPDLSAIKLHYTTTGGETGTITADSSQLLDRFYTFAIDMPTGPDGEDRPEDIYNRLYGLQWDLSSLDTIASFRIEFTAVEHAQLYHLRLDQSDVTHGSTSVFPQEAVWTGADGIQWDAEGNWQDHTPPGPWRNIRFGAGTQAVLDAELEAKSLNFSSAGDFVLSSPTSGITLTSGVNATSDEETSHLISTPLILGKYNLFDIAADNTLILSGPVTGSGFYKQGQGSLVLTGNNHYDREDASFQTNGLIFSGGSSILTGTNTFGGSLATFNIRPDTSVRLAGGHQRLDAGFSVRLLGQTSRLILGDESAPSDQSFLSIEGSISGVPVTGSRIVGGSATPSTLTVTLPSGAAVFGGNLGGGGLHENQLNLVKSGGGFQLLSGSNTHTGTTVIREGALGMDPAGHSIELAGGVLALHGADLSTTLGTGPGEVFFTSHGGFAAHGQEGTSSTDPAALHSITLNGGAALSWNSLLPGGSRLILSASGTNRTLQFNNPLELGTTARLIEINDGGQSIDARFNAPLSGNGGFHKTGAGTLELTAANALTGTAVVHGGTLTITGENGTFSGNLVGGVGTSLRIINAASASRDHRLSPSSSITLHGGYLTYNAVVSAGNSETAGSLHIAKGANTFLTNRSNAGMSTHLTLAGLSRDPGSTLNFSGSNVGNADNRNRIDLLAPPTLTNGIIGGWAHVANEFATYGGNGVAALAEHTTTGDSTWGPGDNVRITSATNLTDHRSIHSLRIASGTTGAVFDLGGRTLHICSGGILASGGGNLGATRIENGVLTAGQPGDPAPELILLTNGPSQTTATITDPSPGTPLSLVKSGSYLFTLLAPTSHTGTTTLNQGNFRLTGTASLASSPLIRINNGATLDVSPLASGFVAAPSQTLTGQGSLIGSAEIHGTLAPDPAISSPLAISGSLTLKPGSTLRIAFEPLPGSTIHSAAAVGGNILTEGSPAILIHAPAVDFSDEHWSTARSFVILTSPSVSSPALSIDPASHGAEDGTWSVSHTSGSVILHWTPTAPSGIRLWRKNLFGSTANSGNGANHADPDGDGLTNLMEYALGADPLSRSSSAIPSLAMEKDGLSFDIPATPPADVIYRVQASSDLLLWENLAILQPGGVWEWQGQGAPRIHLTSSGEATRVTVRDDNASSVPPLRFFRLNTTISNQP